MAARDKARYETEAKTYEVSIDYCLGLWNDSFSCISFLPRTDLSSLPFPSLSFSFFQSSGAKKAFTDASAASATAAAAPEEEEEE